MSIVDLLKQDLEDTKASVEVRTAIGMILTVVHDETNFKELAVALFAAAQQGDGWDKEEFIQ